MLKIPEMKSIGIGTTLYLSIACILSENAHDSNIAMRIQKQGNKNYEMVNQE